MCWSHERALYLDLSCGMTAGSGERLWAAAGALLGDPSVRKAGFRLRDQLAALLQHGIQVSPGMLIFSPFPSRMCNAALAHASASQRYSKLVGIALR